MTRVEDILEIESPPWTVWKVLIDPSSIAKLYPDVITVDVAPDGPLGVGSKAKIMARLGKTRVVVYVAVVRADTESCFASVQQPGGLFESFQQTVFLEGMGPHTRVKVLFEYELVKEYAESITQEAFMDSRVADNLKWYSRNLKEICELLPLPS
jgi:carbon monoxide dehydrogenase subunit G